MAGSTPAGTGGSSVTSSPSWVRDSVIPPACNPLPLTVSHVGVNRGPGNSRIGAPAETAGKVVVNDAACLQRSVDRDRAREGESVPPQFPGARLGGRRPGGNVGCGG